MFGGAFSCLAGKWMQIEHISRPIPRLLSCTPSRTDIEKLAVALYREDNDLASRLGDHSVGVEVCGAGVQTRPCCYGRVASFGYPAKERTGSGQMLSCQDGVQV